MANPINQKSGLLIGIGMAILIVIIIIIVSNTDKQNSSFDKKSDASLGTSAFYKLLKLKYEVQDVNHNIKSVLQEPNNNSLLVSINDELLINENTTNLLVEYIRKGGMALIISKSMPKYLQSLLFHNDDYLHLNLSNHNFLDFVYFEEVENLKSSFFHPELKENVFDLDIKNIYASKNPYVPIYYIPSVYYTQPNTTYEILPLSKIYTTSSVLGSNFFSIDSAANFVRFSIGKGHLYYHLTPELFTNYFLSKPENLPALNSVFAHMNISKICWASAAMISNDNVTPEDILKAPVMSRMEFIYGQTMLRNAWYVMLIAGIIFIIFKGKRRQRVIPVLEQPENNSKNFINNIAYLYYKTNNHKNIAQKLSDNFTLDLNNRYKLNLKIGNAITEENMFLLSKMANIQLDKLKPIIETYNLFFKGHIQFTEAKLKELYDLIQQYYQLEQEADYLVKV